MLKKILLVSFAIILGTSWLQLQAAVTNTQAQSVVGYWTTFDHKNHNAPSSVIQITKDSSGEISGDIVHIFPELGHGPKDKCVLCKGPLHNVPILGLKLVWDFHEDPTLKGKYYDGFVLDPTNGKTYKCNMWLSDDGQQLTGHGYIGISLMGRSDVWQRTGLMPKAQREPIKHMNITQHRGL